MKDPAPLAVIGERGAMTMPDSRLEMLFIEQAALRPDATAIVFQGGETSYGTLDAWSNGIARRLQSRGVGPGVIVGLCLRRSPAMISIMLAVLKAGGAYLPLDPSYPVDRLQAMMAHGGAALLIVDSGLPANLRWDGDLYKVADISPTSQSTDLEPLPTRGNAGDIAYVIHTSGSTGRPKGVMLCHSAVRLVRWMAETMDAGDIARVAATTSICFDPSIIEIFGTLGTGGTIILKVNALEPFQSHERPTMLAAPPPVLARLAEIGAIPDSVRAIISGGEALTAELAHALHATTSVQRIYNHYGPTEATTCATVALVDPHDGADPSIGWPIAGAEIFLLDADGGSVAQGEIGEICIGGANLAIGYLDDPIATEALFRPHPYRTGERVYHTGDLGVLGPDGRLWFRGRRDTQVKIRGFRVELGDVEAALVRLAGVREAAVVAGRDRRDRTILTAFVVADVRLELADLRRNLAERLPPHMLPARLIPLGRLPLGPTGKIDRDRLGVLQENQGRARMASVKPATLMLETAASDGNILGLLISQIFARHLELPEMGPDDDFFDHGGDSLLAIDVAIELEELTKLPVSAALLGQKATPRCLAAAMAGLGAVDDTILRPLQVRGTEAPIYCVPELIGRAVSYTSVARHFADRRAVIGLTPGRTLPPTPSLRALSHRYLDAIRAQRAHGPYVISGYSFSASQAFDLACLCEQVGEPVSLVLIDGPLLGQTITLRQLGNWMRQEVALLGARDAIGHIRHSCPIWSRLPRMGRRSVSRGAVPRFVPQADKAFAQWLMQATINYQAEPFHGPSLLIRSTEPPTLFRLLDSDSHLGWKRLIPALRVAVMDETHLHMVQEPAVARLQELIEKGLNNGFKDAEKVDVGADDLSPLSPEIVIRV